MIEKFDGGNKLINIV